MSDKTGIQWTDATWNPLRGCSKVSAGCTHCYAETLAKRFSSPGMPYEGTITDGRWNGHIRLVPEVLDQPLRWKRPRKIFVNSMSDLFHPNVPFDYIDQVFAVMALAPQHTFQILTKRPERMRDYMNAQDRDEAIGHEAMYLYEKFGGRGDCSLAAGLIHGPGKISNLPVPEHPKAWPLPNVWLGVSVENQKAADERIPFLLQTPAAVRFLSDEPLLGLVNLNKISRRSIDGDWTYFDDALTGFRATKAGGSYGPKIDWVIVGSESGPKRRGCDIEWVRDIRDQCISAGVPLFLKQLHIDGVKVGTPELDGQRWVEFPS